MGFLRDIKETAQDIGAVLKLRQTGNTRSLSILQTLVQNINSYREPDFFDITGASYVSTASDIVGLYDNKISPLDIYDMIHRDTYFPGLFEQLIETLFSKKYYITVAKDSEGNLKGDQGQAKRYEAMLDRINIEDMIEKIVYALRADGGGNCLLFTSRNPDGTLEYNVEPFLDFGRPRVKVQGDNRTKKIVRYDVVDWKYLPIYTIDPKENYFMHVRYTRAGDYRFSRNPAKRAVYWYILKKYLAGSNLALFKNGLQSPTIMVPDFSALTALVTAMGDDNNKVSSDQKAEWMKDPIQYLSKLSQMDKTVLENMTGQARRNNSLIKLSMPMKFEKVPLTNADMKTLELINLCDQQMGYALRTSKGLINTVDSKYSNAEIEANNWGELVVDPLKRQIEQIIERFFLPALDIDYDPTVYRVRFGREVDDEDIALFNAKTNKNMTVANIIATLPPGYIYNLETNAIELEAKSGVNEQTPVNTSQVDDVENAIDEIENINRVAESFEEKRDRIFDMYHNTVNMNRTELSNWSETEESKKAGKDRSPITRNLELLDTMKKDWTAKHVTWAARTIAFIKRATTVGNVGEHVLKNWSYDKAKTGSASEYPTKPKRGYNTPKTSELTKVDTQSIANRAKKPFKQSPAHVAIESAEGKRFNDTLQRAIKRQMDKYISAAKKRKSPQDAIESFTKDFPAISTVGLSVNVFKDQIMKFAQPGIKEVNALTNKKRAADDGFEYPQSIKNMMDAKAQMMIKGYDSLGQQQKEWVARYYKKRIDLTGYAGIDGETSDQVNNAIKKFMDNNAGGTIDELVNDLEDLSPILSENRAMVIANTEIAQGIEATRFNMYADAGYDEKHWWNVHDSRVRDAHTQFEDQGWIGINEDFTTDDGYTAQSPSDEIQCRCSVSYRISGDNNASDE